MPRKRALLLSPFQGALRERNTRDSEKSDVKSEVLGAEVFLESDMKLMLFCRKQIQHIRMSYVPSGAISFEEDGSSSYRLFLHRSFSERCSISATCLVVLRSKKFL